jgi:hypothetical protein
MRRFYNYPINLLNLDCYIGLMPHVETIIHCFTYYHNFLILIFLNHNELP